MCRKARALIALKHVIGEGISFGELKVRLHIARLHIGIGIISLAVQTIRSRFLAERLDLIGAVHSACVVRRV